MNKSESKYYNTALLMNQAFIELLNKKDFEFITVKDICKKAGVNRSTFYLHYESINDLLEGAWIISIKDLLNILTKTLRILLKKLKIVPAKT